MVNIDQLNAVREKVEEKTMLGTNREVFDPVKKVNIEYYSDGTGNWEVESEYQAKSRHNFTYRFISKNEYLFISDIEKVTLKYKILESDKNTFTYMLIGRMVNGEEKDLEKFRQPIPHTFQRN